MEIGTIVKVNIPYKLGERRKGKEKRYKEGKIVAIYTNFVLVEFETKYNENYSMHAHLVSRNPAIK